MLEKFTVETKHDQMELKQSMQASNNKKHMIGLHHHALMYHAWLASPTPLDFELKSRQAGSNRPDNQGCLDLPLPNTHISHLEDYCLL